MTWHAVAKVGEIPSGRSKLVTVAGRRIAVFRSGERFFAIQDRCPHGGASLCEGRLVGLATSPRPGDYVLERPQEFVRCPWHGWEFDVTTGQSHCDPDRMQVRSFPVSVGGVECAGDVEAIEIYPASVVGDAVIVEIDPRDTIEAVVVERKQEAEGVVALTLAAAHGGVLPVFEAGAHVDLHLSPTLVRQYSLCGDPRERHTYRLAVLLEPNSRGGSTVVHQTLRAGDRTRIGRPRNHFRLAADTRRKVLVAGGIGITPFVAMASQLLGSGTDFELHYAARSIARAAFLPDLRAMLPPRRLRSYMGTDGSSGRFDIAQALAGEAGSDIYVCGPERLVEAVLAFCRQSGFPEEHLHAERFTAMTQKDGASFVIRAVRSGVVATVPSGRSAAEVLAEHGVDVRVSCEQGVCGSCLTPVVAGIPDHRDSFQTGREKSTNAHVALCCSRARTAELTVEA